MWIMAASSLLASFRSVCLACVCMKADVDFAVLNSLSSTAHLLKQEKMQCNISAPQQL